MQLNSILHLCIHTDLEALSSLSQSFPVFMRLEKLDYNKLSILFVEIWRRSRDQDANPRGGQHPHMSAEGHSIVDIKFSASLLAILPLLALCNVIEHMYRHISWCWAQHHSSSGIEDLFNKSLLLMKFFLARVYCFRTLA